MFVQMMTHRLDMCYYNIMILYNDNNINNMILLFVLLIDLHQSRKVTRSEKQRIKRALKKNTWIKLEHRVC